MLKIGGFTPLSTTDWPGQLAAVVFVQGCPWRCHYCHNIDLQARDGGEPGGWLRALGTIVRRQGLLDGIVFSGGEPTLDPELPDAIETVRSLGFKVGLHTAGIYPDRLKQILPLIDWVGLDIKADFADYQHITDIPRSGQPAWHSLQAVLDAVEHKGLDLEVRTTYHPDLHASAHLLTLGRTLYQLGIQRWVIQEFRPTHMTHGPLKAGYTPPPETLPQSLRDTGLTIELR
jgi:pyruvate formate lyase activating enzyme